MPILRVLKGHPQRDYSVEDQPISIGRERGQMIRLRGKEISRCHAEVVPEGGRFYLTDRDSHNSTYLNNRRIEPHTRYPLEHNDVIKICNHILVFLVHDSGSWRDLEFDSSREAVDIVEDDAEDNSDVSTRLPSSARSWEERISLNPQRKLRAIMQIAAELQNATGLNAVLTRVLDSLLGLFKEAECALIVFREEDGHRIFPTVVRHREPNSQDRVTVSSTIVRSVLENQRSLLILNVLGDPDLKDQDSVYSGGLKSLMCAPILDFDGRSLAVVQVDTRTRPHRFTKDDLDLLSMVVRMLSFVVEEARLRVALLGQRTLQRDLEVAREIQLSLLPNDMPDVPGYDFYDFYAPAKIVGGDFYDYLQLPNGCLAVLLGDVSGKGVPAALLSAKLSSELRVYLASGLSPVEVLQRSNASYLDRAPESTLVTMVLLVLDPRTHEVQIANAGHMRPVLVRPGAAPENLGDDEAGCPLGVLPNPEYRCCRVTLEKDDCLVLYSDGVTDASNPEQDLFEVERLLELLANSSGTASDIGQLIVERVEQFVGSEPQRDDTCIVCLSRTQ